MKSTVLILFLFFNTVLMAQSTPGRVLWSEDFDGGVPTCWSIINNAANANNWVWDTVYRPGMFSQCESAINSYSAENGFMQLPMDFYNTPMVMPIAMDASLQSCALTIPAVPSITLRFQQKIRYCCSQANEAVVEVSTDGISWTTYNAKVGIAPNALSDDPLVTEINVSSTLANQTTAYIRFRATGMTHYYWMIDDVELIETPTNSLGLVYPKVSYDQFDFLRYAKIPHGLTDTLTFEAVVKNYGSSSFSSVMSSLVVEYDTVRTSHGTTSTVYSSTSVPLSALSSGSTGTTVIPNSFFVPDSIGFYEMNFSATSTPTNQNPNFAKGRLQLEITDSVLAKNHGTYLCERELSDAGSITGELFQIGASGGIPTSISFDLGLYIVNTMDVKAHIWDFDPSLPLSQAVNLIPLSSSAIYTLTSANANQRLTLKLLNSAVLIPGKTYLVGIEVMSANGINALTLKQSQPLYADYDTSKHGLTYNNGGSAVWEREYMNQGISLNFGQLSTSVSEFNVHSPSDYSLFPNPSDGIFEVQASSNNQPLSLMVRNYTGQLVYQSRSLNDDYRIDLSGHPKGIYFVQLGEGKDQLIKKVVIQ